MTLPLLSSVPSRRSIPSEGDIARVSDILDFVLPSNFSVKIKLFDFNASPLDVTSTVVRALPSIRSMMKLYSGRSPLAAAFHADSAAACA